MQPNVIIPSQWIQIELHPLRQIDVAHYHSSMFNDIQTNHYNL